MFARAAALQARAPDRFAVAWAGGRNYAARRTFILWMKRTSATLAVICSGVAFTAAPRPSGEDPAVAAERPPAKCLRQGAPAKTLAASKTLSVIEDRSAVSVCVRASGRRVELGPPAKLESCFPDYCGIGPVAVAGRIVAYSRERGGRSGPDYRIIVRDYGSGRRLSENPNGVPHAEDFNTCVGATGGTRNAGIGPTTALVLRAGGAVAWIAQRCDPRSATSYEVFTQPRSGIPKLRGASFTINPSSLRLERTGVSWIDAGVRHRASFTS